MNILIAIDPGVTPGYAVFNAGEYSSNNVRGALIQSGFSKPKPKETDKNRIRRILNLCQNLAKAYEKHTITVVAENQFHTPGAGMSLQYNIANCHQILGYIKVAFLDYPFETYLPRDWQGALLCGFGKMKTKDKSLLVCKRLGVAVKNHNEADAILIGVYVLDHMKLAERVKEAV